LPRFLKSGPRRAGGKYFPGGVGAVPVQIDIHHEEGYMSAYYIGQVTDDELLEGWKTFYEGPDWVPGLPTLLDLSQTKAAKLTAQGIQRLVGYYKRIYEEHGLSDIKVAIYAPTPLEYGLTRMYQALTDEHLQKVLVSRDMNEARDYLGLKRIAA
jgi:hypothetical protein